MRTTIDLPDDLFKRTKIAAVKRGSTLREFISEALQAQLAAGQPGQRLESAPIQLDSHSPLRQLSIAEIKNMDAEAEAENQLAVYSRR